MFTIDIGSTALFHSNRVRCVTYKIPCLIEHKTTILVTGTGTWVSQIPVETWYNEQLEIVGGDGNTIEQKRLVMLWN